MPDYSKAVIYRIINRETGENLYVGSTCYYKQRMIKHKSQCNNPNSTYHNFPIYKHIRELGGWSAVRHVMIEEFIECQNKLQLVKKEQEYIDQFSGTKNAIKSYSELTGKEYQKQYQKQYRNENADKIKEQMKQYYIENADKIKEQKKQYRNENAAAIKEQKRQAYLKKKQLQA